MPTSTKWDKLFLILDIWANKFEEDKQLKFLLKSEKKVIDLIKCLENEGKISEKEYELNYHRVSRPDIFYGSLKVHKPAINNCPKLCPILAVIGTPAYKLAKFLVPILSPLTVFWYMTRFLWLTKFVVFVLNISWPVLMLEFCWPIFLYNIPLQIYWNLYWWFVLWYCLFNMKFTVSARKSSHQACGPCYMQLCVFTYTYFPFLLKNKKLVWLLFFSAN